MKQKEFMDLIQELKELNSTLNFLEIDLRYIFV